MSGTLICAGGSGARILEGVLQLCAAGIGPDKLGILMIDPDGANGNTARAKKLVDSYQQCRSILGSDGWGGRFFHTSLDLLQPNEGDRGLNVCTLVGADQKFADLLNYQSLSEAELDIVHLLFTEEEIQMHMKFGFRGHPSLGATALGLLPLMRDERPWNQMKQRLQAELALGETRVLIAGSVFGGTGASVFFPLTRFLRQLPDKNLDRLLVGALALVPYFQFRSDNAETKGTVQAEWFDLATRAAAQFYQHLRTNGDWDFASMYWLGDDSPTEVKWDALGGGRGQENPAHFVELLGAITALDYFAGAPVEGCCYYSGPPECKEEDLKNKNVVSWDHIPLGRLKKEEIQAQLLQFALVGAMHVGFFAPMLANDRLHKMPLAVPWYLDRFAVTNHRLDSPAAKEGLKALTTFFTGQHYPWWQQICLSAPQRVRLLNDSALGPGEQTGDVVVDLRRLANLIYPDGGNHTLDTVDRFFTDTVRVASAVGGAEDVPLYVSILAAAAERFVGREYQRQEETA